MRRLVCLDGLRGVLAFYVMLSHTLPFAPMPGWLVWLFSHGGAGVDVFFILSGLVIVQSLASFDYRPRPFLIARVARIYPVFLVVFAVRRGGAAAGDRVRADGVDRAGQPGTLHLVGRLAERLGRRSSPTHLTMTHGLFPDGVLPDVWVGLPRRRVEPVDRVAVLPAGAADRRAPGTASAGLAVPGGLGGGRSPGRRWRRTRGSSAAPSCRTRRSISPSGIASAIVVRQGDQGPWRLPGRARRHAGAVRRARRHRQVAAAGGLDACVWRRSSRVILADAASRV